MGFLKELSTTFILLLLKSTVCYNIPPLGLMHVSGSGALKFLNVFFVKSLIAR